MVGTSVVLLQLAAAVGVYNLEVDHVALTQSAANPFLVGMGASAYWTAFLVMLWAAGLGLILAAVLRERGRAAEESEDALLDEHADEGRRWLH